MKPITAILASLTLLGLAAMPALAAEIKGPAATKGTLGAMTMDFAVADKQALTKLKPGQKVEFKVVEKAKGQFVVSKTRATGVSPLNSRARANFSQDFLS